VEGEIARAQAIAIEAEARLGGLARQPAESLIDAYRQQQGLEPSDWVKPAEGGVERLLNVYVSMGVTPPLSKPSEPPPVVIEGAVAKPPRKAKPPKPN
jgi:hypothetical protein